MILTTQTAKTKKNPVFYSSLSLLLACSLKIRPLKHKTQLLNVGQFKATVVKDCGPFSAVLLPCFRVFEHKLHLKEHLLHLDSV